MTLGFMFFSLTYATAKFLTRDLARFQIAWFRVLDLLSAGELDFFDDLDKVDEQARDTLPYGFE